MNIKKLIAKIKHQQDIDLQGCSDLKSVEEYVVRLESHQQISEQILGSVSIFLERGDFDKANEWLQSGIKTMDDMNL
jgi:hypothetical protein